jgi:hypothetical protein
MATKITTALVAALVVGALMTPNHEALARGGGGFGGGGDCAVNATGFGITPRSSHHLLVTLDSFAALGR